MTRRIVWYDRGCPLCRREIALMQGLDWFRRIELIDAADPKPACPLGRAQLLRLCCDVASRFFTLAAWHDARFPGAEGLLNWAYAGFLTVRLRLQSFFK